jgi:uncharacterized membrane protein YcgQ (UPF0703/DUF1980 family)
VLYSFIMTRYIYHAPPHPDSFSHAKYLITHCVVDSGPGVSSIPLDEGMELMADYKMKIAKLLKTKAELINAQNLFDLGAVGIRRIAFRFDIILF